MAGNQHRKITGYRDLTQAEVDAMNKIKAMEAAVAALHAEVVAILPERSEATRQAAVARTEFEHAFMRLVRSVAQPTTPWSA
jgi:hypothetical protein